MDSEEQQVEGEGNLRGGQERGLGPEHSGHGGIPRRGQKHVREHQMDRRTGQCFSGSAERRDGRGPAHA